MFMNNYYDYYKSEIESIKSKNLYRTLRNISSVGNAEIIFNKKKYLNLSSNDYLGIADNTELLNEFYLEINDESKSNDFRLGSGSSRLLSGNYNLYEKLETELAKAYESESALVFNSGYHANIGILPALTGKGDLIISDKLNHASIIDGIRLSNADYLRYKHLDYKHLEKLLAAKRNNYNKVIIISESIFSMDGDVVDLQKLVDIKNKYNTMLYIDEAHAFATRGKSGLGIAEEQNLISKIDFIVGTFGKAFASQGAFVVCKSVIREFLINKMRSLIFTTSLPPVVVNWNLFLLKKIKSFSVERKKLNLISDILIEEFQKNGLSITSSSNIVPVILGKNSVAEEVATEMQKHLYYIFAVRPPTVPEGTARLRISLTANIPENKVLEIARVITKLITKHAI